MSGIARRVFVLGGFTSEFLGKGHPNFIWKKHPDFGKRENPTLEEQLSQSVRGALAATRVDPKQVQKAFVGNFAGELFSSQGHLGSALVGSFPSSPLRFIPSLRVEGACASGGLAISCGVDAVQAGADVVLVAGAEVQTTHSARDGANFLARASHYSRQRSIDDFTFPALFAQRMKAYCEHYKVDMRDVARVSVKAYANAAKNPLAHMHTAPKLTLDAAATASDSNPSFLGNPELKPYLRVSDCSQVSDGAAALVLVSESGLAKLGASIHDTIEILNLTVATDSLYEDPPQLYQLQTTAAACSRAFSTLGVSPKAVDVAEVHDCFSIAEVMMTEAIGFAPPGHGTHLLKEGITDIEGAHPVNTGGGLIGFGHPVGATGIKQALEVYRQMKRTCGAYQIPRSASLGLTVNMGGSDKTVVVGLYGNR